MKRAAFVTLMVAAAGCKTAGSEAKLQDATVDGAAAGQSQVVGLDIMDDSPAVTMIPLDVQPATDWSYGSGREYWLYSTRGQFMTFDANSKYYPYQHREKCQGKESDPTSACSVQPSNVAKACQNVASLTLKAILENEPEEYKALKQQFGGSLSPFGWMNDGHSDAMYAKATWQGPFIWRGSAKAVQTGGPCPPDFKQLSGYVKWVSSVDKNGRCLTPSLGQFLALVKTARACLEQNLATGN